MNSDLATYWELIESPQSAPGVPTNLQYLDYASALLLTGTPEIPFPGTPSYAMNYGQFLTIQSSVAPAPTTQVYSLDYGTLLLLLGNGPPIPILYPTFLAAIRAMLLSQQQWAAQLRGGIWHRQVPPGYKNPCGVYIVPSAIDERIGGKKFIQNGTFQISIYSGNSSQARLIADDAADILTDTAGKNLVWKNGRMMYFSRSNVASPLPPTNGYGGSNVQGEIRTFDYQFHGSYLY